MRWTAGIALALVLAGLGPVAAQTPAVVPQVLTLDQDRLYGESLFGKATEAKSAAVAQALAAENRKLEADLAAEEADLTQKRATMTSAEFQSLADAFDAKVEKLRKDQAAKADALQQQREAGRKAFFQSAVPVLADLMRQLGAFAILDNNAVVLAFETIDVTDRAIAVIDAQIGDGTTPATGPRLTPEATVPKP